MDPNEVLAYLNELGYKNITANQLKDFLIDLKKLMKYVNEQELNEDQLQEYIANHQAEIVKNTEEHVTPHKNNTKYTKQYKPSVTLTDSRRRSSQNPTKSNLRQSKNLAQGTNQAQTSNNHSNTQVQTNDLAQSYDYQFLSNKIPQRSSAYSQISNKYPQGNQRLNIENPPRISNMSNNNEVSDIQTQKFDMNRLASVPTYHELYQNPQPSYQTRRRSSNRHFYDGRNQTHGNPSPRYYEEYDEDGNIYRVQSQLYNEDTNYLAPNYDNQYIYHRNYRPSYEFPSYDDNDALFDPNEYYDERQEMYGDEDDMGRVANYSLYAKPNENTKGQTKSPTSNDIHHNLHSADTISFKLKKNPQMQYVRPQKPNTNDQISTVDVGVQYTEMPTTESTQTFNCDERGIQYYLNKPNKICGIRCPDRPNTDIKFMQSSTSRNPCVKFKNDNKCMQCSHSDIISNQLKCVPSNVSIKAPSCKKIPNPCPCPSKKKDLDLKPKSSFIRPRLELKPAKSDPVALYHMYQEEWKRIKIPGKDSHMDLRWSIREKMMGSGDHYGVII